MKNGPEFRIVGGASEEHKEELRKTMDDRFYDNRKSLPPETLKLLESKEIPKSEKELAAINFANKETDRLMEESGLESYDIPPDNYYIVASDVYVKYADIFSVATASYKNQNMVFNSKYSQGPKFASAAIHETLHLKGHYALELEEDEMSPREYRMGIDVFPSRKSSHKRRFGGLHEAIVSAQEKKSFSKIFDLPEFAEEKEWMASEKAKYLIRAKALELKIPEDDIGWIDKNDPSVCNQFTYFGPRKVLSYVCEEIQKKHSEQYKDTDEVFKEFLKAHFTGRLLPVARLIKDVFGDEGLTVLGEMGIYNHDAQSCMESLNAIIAKNNKKSLVSRIKKFIR